MKDINYYLSRGFSKDMAKYYISGRKKIIDVKANEDFTLIITFDNGEKRLIDCKTFIKDNTVFEALKDYEVFKRVYVDNTHCISWDKNPNIDSEKVWNNKISLCPDSSYVDSIPLKPL